MTERLLATILYEDQRGPTQSLALHDLVVSCVFDEVDGNLGALRKQFEPQPKKRNANVRKAVRDDATKICRRGQRLVAVFDDDKVRDLYKLPADTRTADVISNIRKECSESEQLRVVLLERNLETVIEAAAACDDQIPQDLVRSATQDKSLLARDQVFGHFARPGDKAKRDCILNRVPSLKQLRDELVRLVQSNRPS